MMQNVTISLGQEELRWLRQHVKNRSEFIRQAVAAHRAGEWVYKP